MPRKRSRDVTTQEAFSPTPHMKQLFRAILTMKTDEELSSFFRDLLTPAELEEIANRWQAVRLLLAGEPYAAIAEKLGMSTTTVTRVAYWLTRGTGGYRTAAKRLLLPGKKEP